MILLLLFILILYNRWYQTWPRLSAVAADVPSSTMRHPAILYDTFFTVFSNAEFVQSMPSRSPNDGAISPEVLHQLRNFSAVYRFRVRSQAAVGGFVPAFGERLLLGKIAEGTIRVTHEMRVRRR